MNAMVTVILSLLGTLAPLFTSSDQIAKVIATLIQIIPVITKEAQDLVQPVKNIIAALQANSCRRRPADGRFGCSRRAGRCRLRCGCGCR
jgi:hypothetical protein